MGNRQRFARDSNPTILTHELGGEAIFGRELKVHTNKIAPHCHYVNNYLFISKTFCLFLAFRVV